MAVYLKELFYVVSGAVLALGIMELMKPGLILAYLNFNFLLLFWLIIGILIIIINKKTIR